MTPKARQIAADLSALTVLIRADDAELEDIEAATQAILDDINATTGSTLELPDGEPMTVEDAIRTLNGAATLLGKGELVGCGQHLASIFDRPADAPPAEDEEDDATPMTLERLEGMKVADLADLAATLDPPLELTGKKPEKVAAIAERLGLT